MSSFKNSGFKLNCHQVNSTWVIIVEFYVDL